MDLPEKSPDLNSPTGDYRSRMAHLSASPGWTGALVLSLVLTLALITISSTASAAAEPYSVPYKSYTYDYWGRPVLAPQAYLPARVIDGQTLGVGRLTDPRDLYIDKTGIYIADSGNNRVLCLDSSWGLKRVIAEFTVSGKLQTFRNPRGVFVDRDANIYVADTENARVVVLDSDGQFVREITSPKPGPDGVIPDGFRFRPSKLGVDPAGRTYVISDEVYEGILVFDPDGDFGGFIGAPRVTLNPLDYLWSRIATQAQRGKMSLFLPTEYSSIEVDDRGFLFATVSGGAIRAEEAVRRLNSSGQDVLRRNGFAPPIGDYGTGITEPSSFVDVTAREDGIYSVLDKRRGRVFTYDDNGNLLYVFGGLGYQEGTFVEPVAIASLGANLAVLDRRVGRVTVFEPTEYAILIHEALHYYYRGAYEQCTQAWEEVLARNANCDLAYNGIARALLRAHDYLGAMRNYRLGTGLTGYSEAFRHYRRELIEGSFGAFMSVVLLAVALFAFARNGGGRVRSWRHRAATVNDGALQSGIETYSMHSPHLLRSGEPPHAGTISHLGAASHLGPGIRRWFTRLCRELSYALHVVFHPFDGFWSLKHEKAGSIPTAVILLVFVAFTYVLREQYTGFIFNPRVSQRNIIMELASVLVPFLLWCMVNWSLTTLVEGKGRFRDIFISTAYALTPIIIITLPTTLISNFMIIEEGAFYYLLLSVAVLWTGVLIFIGTMVAHEFSLPKTALTSVLTVAGIGVVIFIGLLFLAVTEQVTAFVMNVFMEVTLRS